MKTAYSQHELACEHAPPLVCTAAKSCCGDQWEAAYRRFETPAEEIAKFIGRLRWFSIPRWPHDARIACLFCGRGNCLVALERLGFEHIAGVDLSATLLDEYQGNAKRYVADCRQLPLEDDSQEIVIVQGGLHHLEDLTTDLPQVLGEIHRVLGDQGRLALVEPWRTPFLDFVHGACWFTPARRLWGRIDALGTMIEHERSTYEQWLGRPKEILTVLHEYFAPQKEERKWGKLKFLGVKRSAPAAPSAD